MKEIIVIGAGACGLMVARTLVENGYKVSVLEARDRIGGRIHTIHSKFSLPIEAGAEFMHGSQPITQSLLKEAGVRTSLLSGERYQLWNGRMEEGDFFDGWQEMTDKLEQMDKDTDMESFLKRYFADEKYNGLRSRVRGFVEGYDAADMNRVSALALKEEWSESDDEHQYHIEGGYSGLIEFLERKIISAGGKIFLLSPVTEIHWDAGKVRVVTTTKAEFSGEKVIVTIPLGALQQQVVEFFPAIPDHQQAFQSMGFGTVSKFFFEFRNAFWEDRVPRTLKNLAFIFSDAEIPTWWSQRPHKAPLLTGWIGGPPARRLPESEENLFEKAVRSLSYIFNSPPKDIKAEIVQWTIRNWAHDAFAFGAYAYPTIHTSRAQDLVSKPLRDALYFAGEAMYKGSAIGTVEAALHSAKEVAKDIMLKD